uniref:Uncharacterized protein n=1 Tax=Ciona intestinalis TaxID=7719 RepID=H2XZU1_CIOIN
VFKSSTTDLICEHRSNALDAFFPTTQVKIVFAFPCLLHFVMTKFITPGVFPTT